MMTDRKIAMTFAEAIIANHEDQMDKNVEVWRQCLMISKRNMIPPMGIEDILYLLQKGTLRSLEQALLLLMAEIEFRKFHRQGLP